MNTWFTSDTHFGHANAIKHCNRPFASADEMDEALIANWNAVVGPRDEIWHLGDFAFRNGTAATNYLRRLNGRKHLIWGNHDSNQVRKIAQWTSSQPYAEITVDKQRIVLFHYGMRVWNKLHHGAIHLYGHSHSNLPGTRKSLDVGTDCWNFFPVNLAQIQERLATLPEAHEVTIVPRRNTNREYPTLPDEE